MKKGILSLVLMFCTFVAGPAFAGDTEVGLGGEFVKVDIEGEDDPWSFNGEALFGGKLKIGPHVVLSNVTELNRMGGVLEWNFFGDDAAITPFIGATADWFQDDIDGTDRHLIQGRAGFKVKLGEGAAIKPYAFDTIDGRGKDSTDLGVGLLIIAKLGDGK